MTDNNCVICLSSLSSLSDENGENGENGENNENNENNIYKLDCNHKFHTKCIMEWFRSSNGNCPLCNDNPFQQNNDYSIFYHSNLLDNRFKTIKQYSRKKEAPEKLKKEIKKFNELNKKYNDSNKKMKDFARDPTFKELEKKNRENRKENWGKLRKVKNQKEKIVTMYPMISIS